MLYLKIYIFKTKSDLLHKENPFGWRLFFVVQVWPFSLLICTFWTLCVCCISHFKVVFELNNGNLSISFRLYKHHILLLHNLIKIQYFFLPSNCCWRTIVLFLFGIVLVAWNFECFGHHVLFLQFKGGKCPFCRVFLSFKKILPRLQ